MLEVNQVAVRDLGYHLRDIPEVLVSIQPFDAEWVVHTALTLFALHQQGVTLKVSV